MGIVHTSNEYKGEAYTRFPLQFRLKWPPGCQSTYQRSNEALYLKRTSLTHERETTGRWIHPDQLQNIVQGFLSRGVVGLKFLCVTQVQRNAS